MSRLSKALFVGSLFLLSGCGHLDFGPDKGLTYYDPKPYFFVTTTKDCVATGTVVLLPETKREVKLVSGYGLSDLSVNLSNGMITSVGQKTDPSIPATITSVAGLATAVGALAKPAKVEPEKPTQCTPTAVLYPIENGSPNPNAGIHFPVR
jgi:hypothetical protein